MGEQSRSIFVVSDSTGETAEKVVRAALLQFPDQKVRVRLFTRVRDRVAVREVLEKAREQHALTVFTLVAPDMRETFHALATEMSVEAVDVIGTLILKVSAFLQATPINLPTSSMPLSEEYFRRVEAIDFAVKNDDGKEPHNLSKADLVLTGVSRTSKTPLSTYLAGRGLKVANVPLVLGVEPPQELYAVPDERVVALELGLDPLLEIRRQRLLQLGMPATATYGLRQHVQAEIDYAKAIFEQHPRWLRLDVTNRAIEETAAIILETLKDREESR